MDFDLKKYKKQWRLANRLKCRAYARNYYYRNKSKCAKSSASWKRRNRKKVCQYALQHRARNLEKCKARRVAHYWKHRDPNTPRQVRLSPWERKKRHNAATAAWRKKNYEHIRAYNNRRLATNPHARFKHLMNVKLRKVLKSQGAKKSASCRVLFGIGTLGLIRHIESQFKKGMNWNNRGTYGWHIDHIRPCASFDLKRPAQQRACFHYTNLQPLWWWENLLKGDRIAA